MGRPIAVDSGTPDLQVSIDDTGVAVATLHRPDHRNAFSAAADIMLKGRTFDGTEVERLGIASRTVDNDAVLDTALGLAHDIALDMAPLSVVVTKRLLWESFAASGD